MKKLLLIILLPLNGCASQPSKKKHDRVTVTVDRQQSPDSPLLANDQLKQLQLDEAIEEVELKKDWTKFKIGLLTGATALVTAGVTVGVTWLSGRCGKG